MVGRSWLPARDRTAGGHANHRYQRILLILTCSGRRAGFVAGFEKLYGTIAHRTGRVADLLSIRNQLYSVDSVLGLFGSPADVSGFTRARGDVPATTHSEGPKCSISIPSVIGSCRSAGICSSGQPGSVLNVCQLVAPYLRAHRGWITRIMNNNGS